MIIEEALRLGAQGYIVKPSPDFPTQGKTVEFPYGRCST
jgi:hypothetical protein